MQHNDIKQYFADCPDLASLDDASRAFLLSRGQEVQLKPGAVLYSEGTTLDDTFCLLLSGELLLEIGGKRVGHIPKNELFGEMAYFIQDKKRSATIIAGSLGAFVLKIRLTRAELGTPGFTGLKAFLGAQAWERFVSNSQRST
jgi:CRP-like cAMP-binding protein